jgi:hypothetical protein
MIEKGKRGDVVSELTWQERWIVLGAERAGVLEVAASAMVRVARAAYLYVHLE